MGARSAIGTLERVAGGAARLVRKLALVAAAAALVIAYYLFRNGLPDETSEAVGRAFVVALAAVPPVVLFVLSFALRALSELPRRIRDTPAEAGERAAEIAGLGGSLRDAKLSSLPLLVWRLGRSAASSRELLTPHASVLPLVSLPFLGLSAACAAAALLEVAVALVLLVALLL